MEKLFVLLCVCLPLIIKAQYVENVSVSQRSNEAGKMVMYVHYDLIAKADNIPFRVSVSFKTKEGKIQLKNLSGKYGELVYPGFGKEIIWDYQEELVHFSGDGDLNVVASPNFQVLSKVKRGKELILKFDPVLEKGKTYTAELYRSGKSIASLGNFSVEKEQATFAVPAKVKAKKNYQIKIIGGESDLFSNIFNIRPKVPHILKIIPAVAVIAFIVLKPSEPEHETPLPGAPSID